jgi:sulfite reductase (ferredoxin)
VSEDRDLRPEIERIKERKDGLDVIEDLMHAARNGGFHALSHDDLALAKWWGIYPQRPEEDGYLMLRVRVSNGVLNAAQLRAIGDLSIRYGRSLADVTTRQCIQLHWLRVEDVPDIFQTLDSVGLTSAQACGDVWRNVVGCPLAGVTADEHFDSTSVVYDLVNEFVGNYRFSNLPRKYKVAVSSCRHHCAQHEINDIGLVGVDAPDLGLGYDVWVGGGLGASARMGRRLGAWIPREQAVEVCGEITALFRDHGNRLKRTRARSKFLVDEWGPERFRQALEERLGRRLEDGPPPAAPLAPMRDHVGFTPQAEPGLYALGGATLRGRVTGENLRALADVAERRGQGRVRLTNRQNVILLDIPEDVREETAAEMADAGVPVHATSVRRQVISCTGIEFCRLSVSETKQVAAGIIDHLESHLGDLDPAVRINVNGCPNACAQYQVADIGLQGALARRGTEKVMGFQLHLGGRLGEDRTFGRRTAKPIAADEARFVLERILVAFRDERQADETFGAWVDRQEPARLEALVGGAVERLEVPDPVPYRHRAVRRSLVTPTWLEGRLEDATVRIVEVSRDPALYPASRIPGAVALDAESVEAAGDGRDLLAALGATPDDLIVVYGDRENRDAALAYRLLHEAGHPGVRLLDGGRRRWIGEGRPVEAGDAPSVLVVEPSEPALSPLDEATAAHAVLVDVSEAEAADVHPDAARLPWEQAVKEDGSLRPLLELRKAFEDVGALPEQPVAIAANGRPEAAFAWFVLHEVLRYPTVVDAAAVACVPGAVR